MAKLKSKLSAVCVVLALMLGGSFSSAEAGTSVYHVPKNIQSKGQKDVTKALLDFLAKVPNDSTIVFPAGGRYNIEGTLYLYNRHGLTIEGNGSEFFASTDGSTVAPPAQPSARWVVSNNWPRGRRHWVFDRSTRITVRNMTIRGANPNANATNAAYVAALEAQHGIEMAGSSGVVENVTIRDTYGDLVSVTRQAHKVAVRNNTLTNSGRQGVTVDHASDVVIEGNYLSHLGRSAIDLEPATSAWSVHRVRIANNRVGYARGFFLAALGKGPVNDIIIERNYVFGDPLAIYVNDTAGGRRANWRVVNNVSSRVWGSPQAMMRFYRVDGVEVSGNSAPIATTQSGKVVETLKACNILAEPNNWIPYTPAGKAAQPLIPLTTDGYESSTNCGAA